MSQIKVSLKSVKAVKDALVNYQNEMNSSVGSFVSQIQSCAGQWQDDDFADLLQSAGDINSGKNDFMSVLGAFIQRLEQKIQAIQNYEQN